MMHDLAGRWADLSAGTQDIILLAALLAPILVLGLVVTWGFSPWRIAFATLWRFRFTNAIYVVLIAVSVGLGVGLIAQERGLREGTARAADKFDLVIAAPGSELTMLMAAVYLQPSDVPLLPAAVYEEIASDPRVAIAAPIGFGDSVGASPVVGTTPQFVTHLAGDLAEGRNFADHEEAVAGALSEFEVGDTFTPAHGVGHAADEHAHEGEAFTVVGKMAPTGAPWDRAVLVPVEATWEVHGLATGHPPGDETVGPPFDPAYFPGTPAIIVRTKELWQAYAVRADFIRDDVMAFFPGTILAQLHARLGDVREAMSLLSTVTQVLVTGAVLTGLLLLTRLYAQRLALLRAIGAPARFAVAVVWTYAASLIVLGALLGIAVGWAATLVLSRIVTARTDILVTAHLGVAELQLVAGFVSVVIALATLPALSVLSRDVVRDLRA